jgi:hypothetical protein
VSQTQGNEVPLSQMGEDKLETIIRVTNRYSPDFGLASDSGATGFHVPTFALGRRLTLDISPQVYLKPYLKTPAKPAELCPKTPNAFEPTPEKAISETLAI